MLMKPLLVSTSPIVGLFAVAALAAGCSAPAAIDACPELPDPGPTAVTTTLPIELVAGDTPYVLGDDARTDGGASFSITKLKLYVSDVELRAPDGGHAHGALLDGDDAALGYGVALVDAENAASLALRMRAPPGEYAGMSFTIGVPSTCSDGETELNHADASTMKAPLDVDSDMYWSWDPGYVFFKVEGRVEDDGSKSFFYHVGEETRLMRVDVAGPFVIDEAGAIDGRIVADVTRLFVTPSGDDEPKLDGEDSDRKAHGGALADQMKENVEGSGFLRMQRAGTEGGAQ